MPSPAGSASRGATTADAPDALEAGARAEDRERLAGRGPVALAGDVAQPQVERVELEPCGELVDQRLDRERGRRRGRRAVGAERHPVGRDAERA